MTVLHDHDIISYLYERDKLLKYLRFKNEVPETMYFGTNTLRETYCQERKV